MELTIYHTISTPGSVPYEKCNYTPEIQQWYSPHKLPKSISLQIAPQNSYTPNASIAQLPRWKYWWTSICLLGSAVTQGFGGIRREGTRGKILSQACPRRGVSLKERMLIGIFTSYICGDVGIRTKYDAYAVIWGVTHWFVVKCADCLQANVNMGTKIHR